jgi:hypothetical protein
MSAPFQKANELAILFGARNLEWVTHPALTNAAPTLPSDGVAIPKSAIRLMLVFDPGAALTNGEIWVYFEAIAKWCRIPGSEELLKDIPSGAPIAERLSLAGVQRVFIRSDNTTSASAHLGYSVLE